MVIKSILCSYHFSNPAVDSLAYYFLENQSNLDDYLMEKLWDQKTFVTLLSKSGLSGLGILPRFPSNLSSFIMLTLLCKYLFHVRSEFLFVKYEVNVK